MGVNLVSKASSAATRPRPVGWQMLFKKQMADIAQRHVWTSSKANLLSSSRRSTTFRKIRSQRLGHHRKMWPLFAARQSSRRPTSLARKLRSSSRSHSRLFRPRTRYRMATATPWTPDPPRSQAIALRARLKTCSPRWEICNETDTHLLVPINTRLPCRER